MNKPFLRKYGKLILVLVGIVLIMVGYRQYRRYRFQKALDRLYEETVIKPDTAIIEDTTIEQSK